MKLAIIILSLLLITNVEFSLAVDASICNDGSSISYYPNGQLKSCLLRDMFFIGGIKCNHLAPIEFYELGMLRSCVSADFFIYEGTIKCNEMSEVAFYPSGKLERCKLAAQVTIEDTVCTEQEDISLFENGRVKFCGTPR